MKVFFLTLSLFGVAWAGLSCECGKRNAGRIVGGKETKMNEYPWMVALQKVYDANTFCGGTIVTPWHVVTSAHCVERYEPHELVIVAGAHDVYEYKENSRQEILVDEVIAHLYYNQTTMDNDIAVLSTLTEIVYNDFVGPACMPNKVFLDELDGQMVKVLGWGTDGQAKPNLESINKLMEIDLQVTSIRYCAGSGGNKICAHTPGKDPCRGDAGGPVVWLDPDTNRFTLVGVVSYRPQCGQTLLPSVQTNLSFFKNWINMRIRFSHHGTVKTCCKV